MQLETTGYPRHRPLMDGCRLLCQLGEGNLVKSSEIEFILSQKAMLQSVSGMLASSQEEPGDEANVVM